MVAKRIVPCLDLTDQGVVKGVHFRHLRQMGDPLELARRYEREGADEVVLLKVDAWRGRGLSPKLLARTSRELSIPLTVGGGVGSVEQAEELLSAGADRVSFNSLALERPQVLTEAADRFGRQAVVLAIDAHREGRGPATVYARGGTLREGWSAAAWAKEGERRGAGEVLLTSIDRDGTHRGYDLPLLRAVRRSVRIPIMASGGAAGPRSFFDAFENAGADAALAAGIFHRGECTVGEVKDYLSSRGIEVRR
ncbi:MAG: imidazole glycerol phosphate synthase subunit HisF [Euryarchaeota archaeon]|nr:imidazole glycerol phosphate synthase subunit HisF [Euryarchaeota archaeon]MDE1836753.1 imidazole glycerol phosphate synthase subunit HisF [Euryarchaeota archaeon]MDE1879771.1 imidazole glycerol phosphate synthase subunit HisF [Euryarchaeota archaeon]MDE2044737.1 imidazole glycerol phosphate synthase subunit HisF [Thermoplasmata archaeon]